MLITILVTVSALIIGIGSGYFLGKDNPIEEICEEIIELETGKDVDLTPNSKEVIVEENKTDQNDKIS